MPVDEGEYGGFHRSGVRALGRQEYAEAFYWFSRAHAAGHPEAADQVYRLIHVAGEPGDPLVVWRPTSEPVALYAAAARSFRAFSATGDVDLLDRAVTLNRESVRSAHTAAALRIAGFRHVVATLWAINDEAAPQVAAAFYRHLTGPDGPTSADAARALHRAVGELRARHPADPTLWVPFVHDGP